MEINKTKHGFAVASLVLGIVSVVLCCCTWVGVICGIVGLVLSILARKAGNTETICKAGLILSIVGLALSVILLIISLVFAGSPQYQEFINKYKKF